MLLGTSACAGAVAVERSVCALDAAEAPGGAHTVIAAVRFTRALAAASLVIADYRLLFARHNEYVSDAYRAERAQVHERSAERLLHLCRRQGSVYVKIGQHIGSMTYGVPPQYSSRMKTLEDHAAHRPFAQIQRMLDRELHGGIANNFDRFEHTPVAAASLAQVHRARLKHSDRDVAVKVQYPGLEALIRSDLWTINALSWLISRVFPNVSLGWISRQFRANLAQELDFSHEAKSARRTARNFSDDHRIAVPDVVDQLTTKRVLTMEYIDGIRIDDAGALKDAGVRPADVASAVVDAFARMMFIDGFVHSDAHGGNILVRPGRRHALGGRAFEVVLLDHGLYHELSDEFRRAYCKLWRGLVLRRTKEVDEACRALGAPGFSNVFSIFLLNRTWNSARQLSTDIRYRMSKEEIHELRRSMRQIGIMSEADVGSVMDEMPDGFVLVAKMNSLVRNVNRSLGASVNRFKVNARYAVRGLSHENSIIADQSMLAASGVEEWLLDSMRSVSRIVTTLAFRVHLELNLLVIDVATLFFSNLQKWHSWWSGDSSVPRADAVRIG